LTLAALEKNELDLSTTAMEEEEGDSREIVLKRRVSQFIQGIFEEDDEDASGHTVHALGAAPVAASDGRIVLRQSRSTNILVSLHFCLYGFIEMHLTDAKLRRQPRAQRVSIAHVMDLGKFSVAAKAPGFRGSENLSVTLDKSADSKRQERIEWEARQREREEETAKLRQQSRIELEVRLLFTAMQQSDD